MNKEVVRNFLSELDIALEGCVRRNLGKDTLQKYDNILVIKSAKNEMFEKLYDTIKAGNSKISLVGDTQTPRYLEEKKIECENIYIYNGRIDWSYGEALKASIYGKKIDAIVFLTYSVYRQSYANITALCEQLRQEYNIPVFAYVVTDDTLNEICDINLFQRGIELAGALINFAEEWD